MSKPAADGDATAARLHFKSLWSRRTLKLDELDQLRNLISMINSSNSQSLCFWRVKQNVKTQQIRAAFRSNLNGLDILQRRTQLSNAVRKPDVFPGVRTACPDRAEVM